MLTTKVRIISHFDAVIRQNSLLNEGVRAMQEKDIRYYSGLMDFLSGLLGPDYEIVLTDLNSVLEIRNGQISGRKKGSPLSDTAMKIISERQYLHRNWILNYQGQADNGKIVRSSTYFIKENDASLSGLLCINFDDSRYKELADRVFRLCHPDNYASENINVSQIRNENQERLYSDVTNMIEDVLHETPGTGRNESGLTYDEKLTVIRELYDKGIFSVKGTIPEIAERIGVSQASMYRYISIIRKEKEE